MPQQCAIPSAVMMTITYLILICWLVPILLYVCYVTRTGLRATLVYGLTKPFILQSMSSLVQLAQIHMLLQFCSRIDCRYIISYQGGNHQLQGTDAMCTMGKKFSRNSTRHINSVHRKLILYQNLFNDIYTATCNCISFLVLYVLHCVVGGYCEFIS